MYLRGLLGFLLFLMIVIAPVTAFGQYYSLLPQHRPPGVDWQQIKTDHFRIIFPDGEDSLAYRASAILESQYPAVKELTGGSLRNFPVVLNNYNDLSNGFVTTLNFRSEIDLSPIKGKALNPQTGNWLENVLPHELVHAAHFNVQQIKSEQKLSIPNLISYISPDIARSFHAFAPYGVHEGLAVYFETASAAPNGGRGNFTYFTNRFNANFANPDRWSMGQTLFVPDYTIPFNRHYIGGFTFMDWLQNAYGESVYKDVIRFHYNHFMFGFGYALKRKTGKWPGQLYALYEQDLKEREENRLSKIDLNTTEESVIIETPFKGEQIHGPAWITENRLLFSGSFYNSSSGFYEYNLDSKKFNQLKETFTVADYNYEIDEELNLYYSSYSRSAKYPNVYHADIHTLNLKTGREQSMTDDARVYAPTKASKTILAIQSNGPFGRIVEVSEDGEIQTVKEFEAANPVSLKVNPAKPNQIAVILNKRGIQALWITTIDSIATDLDKAPDVAFKNGSVFDPDWHPKGNKILFSMDAPPAMNIYEYDLETREITQLTASLYNAFEASYSPSGDAIAYILQLGDENKLAILKDADFLNKPVSNSLLLRRNELSERLNRPLAGEDVFTSLKNIKKESYKMDWSWLRPRLVAPVARKTAEITEWGVGISSIDVLESQSYYAEVTKAQDRFWYDVSYTNKSFFPGVALSTYSRPSFFNTEDAKAGFEIMRQDRGFSISFPFDYTFRGDTRFTGFSIEPEISAEQIKFYDMSATGISDFTSRYKAGVYSQLSINVLSLSRDVQPSSGLVLFGSLDKTLNEPSVNLNLPGNSQSISGERQWAGYYGAFAYLSPLRRWNQSLKLGLQFLQQSSDPIYSNSTIIPMGFRENPFPNSIKDTAYNNLARISTRYAIPLFYPDNGGLTVPLYLSSVYVTGFSHTLTNLNSSDLLDSSRSIFGAGLHAQIKLSNVLFDFGIGIAFEPSRNNTQFIFGEF